jgi:hypothetical protein
MAMVSWKSVRVMDAGFSPRTRNALVRDHRDSLCSVDDWGPLPTMGQVAKMSDYQLLGRPGFGRLTFEEVRNWFERHRVKR